MNVDNVVDEEPNGSRKTVLLGMILVGVLHDLLVLVSVLIAWGLVEPVVKRSKYLSDIVLIESEVVVTDLAALV